MARDGDARELPLGQATARHARLASPGISADYDGLYAKKVRRCLGIHPNGSRWLISSLNSQYSRYFAVSFTLLSVHSIFGSVGKSRWSAVG
jgi:hypothetical protein